MTEPRIVGPRCAPGHSREPGAGCAATLALLAALLLAACGTRPPLRDGPPVAAPAGLDQVPDAEPRVETLRRGGPNKPYEVLGRWYTPAADDVAWRESGLASWYGSAFHGRPTASGERYDMFAMTAAHRTLPIPSYARVRNPANGREVIVRVNDRGPFVDGRVIDLSYTAALRLGLLAGVAPVQLERLTHEQIRAGSWRRGPRTQIAAPQPIDPPPAAPDDDPLGAMLRDRGLAPAGPPSVPATVPR
ncbi:MAG: septal ring lytic transglycosylase RlpA family protein [Rubrivivax sp.]